MKGFDLLFWMPILLIAAGAAQADSYATRSRCSREAGDSAAFFSEAMRTPCFRHRRGWLHRRRARGRGGVRERGSCGDTVITS